MFILITCIIGLLILVGGLIFIHVFSMEQADAMSQSGWEKHVDNEWNRIQKKNQIKNQYQDWAKSLLEKRNKK